MKAIVYKHYGSPEVLKLDEVEKPQPGDDEVLLRVHGASVNPLDWHLMRGEPRVMRIAIGVGRPKDVRFGRDGAGVVEAVGKAVTKLRAGDEVFGTCKGAFAEHACGTEKGLVVKPKNLSFEQAAAFPIAAISALQALRDYGKLKAGERVLVNGASGGVGTFAVQIAKAMGANVTGVCSTRNVELVRSLGADAVVDYTQTDFTRGGSAYDVMLDCIGNHSLEQCSRVLARGGRYVMVGGSDYSVSSMLVEMGAKLMRSMFTGRKFSTLMAKINAEDLAVLRELAEAGKVAAVIDRRYSLGQTAEAVQYLEEGHARGKVVVAIK
ncbi:MAG TPA: NAD(P)-dependent alcohol dehydrogenase [Candidatus Angelobacter sp.]|nr:NAD(P)-dependent alcohol dehydrogenase [Candidatus Angelobacter sp.]